MTKVHKLPAASKQEGYLTGHFLIAMPHMQDPRFKEAIIFLCGHDNQGAMGLVINKLIKSVTLDDLLQQLNLPKSPTVLNLDIHYGGPVEIGRGFMLHSTDYMTDVSVPVLKNVALSSTTVVLEDLLKGQGPKNILLALGYAGWSASQLEGEIKQNGWLTMPADAALIFDTEPDTLWKRTLRTLGITPSNLAPAAGHA